MELHIETTESVNLPLVLSGNVDFAGIEFHRKLNIFEKLCHHSKRMSYDAWGICVS
jgi:hypothetical protein